MNARWISSFALGVAFSAIACGTLAQTLATGQLPPTRLYSIGDSLTRAANANLPGDNLGASWANGYQSLWQEIFGLPNVQSHHQRIDSLFGRSGRRNWIAARNGARVDDWVKQAASVPLLQPTYATVLLGGNDVCRDSPADLPTDAEFEAHVIAGLNALVGGLPQGATALVVAIPNVRALYDFGRTKEALGITSCRTLWRLTGFCEAMLDDDRSDADRAYVEARNAKYNAILKGLVEKTAQSNASKFVRFADAGFTLPAAENHISDIDCFHASWRGQRALSAATWPFGSAGSAAAR